MDSLKRLDTLMAEVSDLRHASGLLTWDERVCMPPGGATAHGNMLATIRRLAHERFTSDEVGRLLEEAKANSAALDPDSELRRKIEVTARDYDKATRVPADYVAEHAHVTSAAYPAWREARAKGDFTIFQPHLQRIVELKQRYVTFFSPLDHPYDALLDDFEPGARTVGIQAMFDTLRPRQVALTQAIRERPQIDDGFLRSPYPEREMLAFAVDVISRFGFDWTRGRQDTSAHPFATAIGSDDVRITTRFNERYPFEMLFGMLHEAGHALYEQGVSPIWNRSLMRGGASLGVHESQSRLWENLIGRSRPFWTYFFPLLKQRFFAQLGHVTLEQFYRGINRVQPSLIRVDADEVTYNLHVMLRVEMEMALLGGEIPVTDAPEFWNTKMKDYLGVAPTDNGNGILQDMHWSVGLFGYFATYTIGNLISVQLFERFQALEPSWEAQVCRGEFSQLRGWLREEIHQHGRRYQPNELVQRVAGADIDAGLYLTYLERKYGELYRSN